MTQRVVHAGARAGRVIATRVLAALAMATAVFVAMPPAISSAASAAETASTQKQPVIAAQCGSAGSVRPKEIVLACGDGNAVAQRLSWSTWTNTGAKGSGSLSENTCTPSCADGTFRSYPASFVLSEIVPTDGRAYFTKIVITFSHASPIKRRSETVADCFDSPPVAGMPVCPANLKHPG